MEKQSLTKPYTGYCQKTNYCRYYSNYYGKYLGHRGYSRYNGYPYRYYGAGFAGYHPHFYSYNNIY